MISSTICRRAKPSKPFVPQVAIILLVLALLLVLFVLAWCFRTKIRCVIRLNLSLVGNENVNGSGSSRSPT